MTWVLLPDLQLQFGEAQLSCKSCVSIEDHNFLCKKANIFFSFTQCAQRVLDSENFYRNIFGIDQKTGIFLLLLISHLNLFLTV